MCAQSCLCAHTVLKMLICGISVDKLYDLMPEKTEGDDLSNESYAYMATIASYNSCLPEVCLGSPTFLPYS